MEAANEWLKTNFLPRFNRQFSVQASSEGTAFVPLLTTQLEDILCVKAERTVGHDNCVSYRGLQLQLPKVNDRCHYVKAKVRVHEYQDGSVGVFHGPRCLGIYTASGQLKEREKNQPELLRCSG